MRVLRLAPLAVSLALAGCVVDNSDLAPRTDAECAARLGANAKACGSRCFTGTDPATGCGQAGCRPCPPGPSGEAAACGPTGACTYATATPVDPVDPVGPGTCAAPSAICGGACVDVRTSTVHCGACDHDCPIDATCSAGLCTPGLVTQGTGTISPRDVVCHEYGWLAFLDGSQRAWMHGSVATTTDYWLVPQYHGPYGTSPRLVAEDGSAAPFVYFAGRAEGGGGGVHEYESALGFVTLVVSTATETFSGIAITDRWAYTTKAEGAAPRIDWVERYGLHASDPRLVGSTTYGGAGADLTAFTGIATAWDSSASAWHVFALGGKTIAHLVETANVPARQDLWTLPAAADRIAAAEQGAAGVVVYVADSATGRVWRRPPGGPAALVAGPTATAPGHLELVADARGAYWTSAATHQVLEYRASDGAVFALAGPSTVTEPRGICLGPWSGYVSWADAATNEIRGVLK